MSARHFVHDPNKAVIDSLRSLTLTNPTLVFDEPNKIIYRHPASIEDSGQRISLVCGGGSGHEPGWAGYVGKGLLTACVVGTVFASPGAEQVRTCLVHRLPPDSTGILVVTANYTGDVLNFGVGVEKARAIGKKVEIIVLGDDVGVGRAKGGKVGRRGIAGAAMAIKCCGALAEMGGSLEQCAKVGRLAAENIVSVAVSLSRVHVIGHPAKDTEEEAERLPEGKVELGMGIHNEPGCEQLEAHLPSNVKVMLAQLLDESDNDRAYVKMGKEDQVVLLINNLGGLSNLELGAVTTEVWTQLNKEYGLKPVRVFSGVFNGSLNGLGFAISLLRLADTGLGPGKSMLNLIDAPTETVAWPTSMDTEAWGKHFPPVDQQAIKYEEAKPGNLRVNPEAFQNALTSGLESVISAEPQVTTYDSIVGDGDCGFGLKRGAEAIIQMLKRSKPTDDLLVRFADVVSVVEKTMDGTSGALYAIFLNSLAANLRAQDSPSPTQTTPRIWAKALSLSLQALSNYTPAKPGDRTLMDALYPFVETLDKTGDVKESAQAAKKGSEATQGMKASLGRSVYVGGEGWQKIPDPGAYGLSAFLTGIAQGL